MDRVSRNQNRSSLLIKSIGHISEIFSCRHHFLNCGDSESFLPIDMLVGGLELHIYFLLLLQCLRARDVIVDGERFVSIDTAQVPLVSLAYTNFCRRDKLVGRHLDWGALADRTTDLEVIRGESLDLGQESHLEVAIFVDFEELLETFLEDRVAKGGCHDVEAASHLDARLHFNDTDLVN